MKSFRDQTLKSSLFLLELVAAIEPRAVDWTCVKKYVVTMMKIIILTMIMMMMMMMMIVIDGGDSK